MQCYPEALDNIVQEKSLFSIILIHLGQHGTDKNLVQCCPRSSRQHCTEKVLFNLVLILLRQYYTSKYTMQFCPRGSRQNCTKTTMFNLVKYSCDKIPCKYQCNVVLESPDNNAQEKILFNVASILLKQHYTGNTLCNVVLEALDNIRQEKSFSLLS